MKKIFVSLLVVFIFTSMGSGSAVSYKVTKDNKIDYKQKMIDVVSKIDLNTRTLEKKVESLEATKNNLNERINILNSSKIKHVIRKEKQDGSVNIILVIKIDSSNKN